MALQKPLTEEELQAQLGASQADEAEGCCVVFCKLIALVPVRRRRCTLRVSRSPSLRPRTLDETRSTPSPRALASRA